MRTRRYLSAIVLAAVAIFGLPAGSPDVAATASAAELLTDAEPLSEAEMQSITGELHIFGIRISLRQIRLSRKQTNRYRDDVHCDILAQNKADDL